MSSNGSDESVHIHAQVCAYSCTDSSLPSLLYNVISMKICAGANVFSGLTFFLPLMSKSKIILVLNVVKEKGPFSTVKRIAYKLQNLS